LPDGVARDLAGVGCSVLCVDGAAESPGVAVDDVQGLAAARYDARPGTCYLLRPDHHVGARWRAFDITDVRRAIARATCNEDIA
jgi:3-(3-hydroxy-phenyl)propionate hydroxylase